MDRQRPTRRAHEPRRGAQPGHRDPGQGDERPARRALRDPRQRQRGDLELAGTTGAQYTHDTVTGNGIGGGTYGGDGIQLGGTGALVADSTIAGNGDPGPYEHGIYTAAASSAWTIERNELHDKAA